MRVNVASKNPVKVEAVKEIIVDYPALAGAEVIPLEPITNVAEQPITLEETIKGAKNRAKNAFVNCNYSFGIEDGLMQVPGTKTGYMTVSVCAIYDGKNYHLGLSSALEWPKKVVQHIIEDKLDGSEAFLRAGLTEKKKLGAEEGSLGLLTKGRINRKDYTKQAVMMALIHLENEQLY